MGNHRRTLPVPSLSRSKFTTLLHRMHVMPQGKRFVHANEPWMWQNALTNDPNLPKWWNCKRLKCLCKRLSRVCTPISPQLSPQHIRCLMRRHEAAALDLRQSMAQAPFRISSGKKASKTPAGPHHHNYQGSTIFDGICWKVARIFPDDN